MLACKIDHASSESPSLRHVPRMAYMLAFATPQS
jgi:hypothetical protein